MKRWVISGVVAALVLAVSAGTFLATRPDAQTPCDGAISMVTQVREKIGEDASVLIYRAPDGTLPIWSGMTSIARGIVSGSFEDIEGEPSADLVDALNAFALTFPTTEDELTDPSGKVQHSLNLIEYLCGA